MHTRAATHFTRHPVGVPTRNAPSPPEDAATNSADLSPRLPPIPRSQLAAFARLTARGVLVL